MPSHWRGGGAVGAAIVASVMETTTEIDPHMLAAQRAVAQDGSVIEVVASLDLRAVSVRDVVLDCCNGVLVVGLLRDGITPDAYTRWVKQVRASGGTARQTVRIEWDPLCASVPIARSD